ncbi:MAG: MFS transporter [Thaumarchaeota archaeon]|nr:MFS transporter [Nitrososphaerota archaeon]
MSQPPIQRGKASWMASLVPYSLVSGTIGTLVQIYILNLGGTVLDVGLSVTLSTAITIPASIFWGSVSDRLKRRKPIIALSFAALAGFFALFLLANTVDEVLLIFTVYSFVNSAPSTPINLLILETQEKAKWATAYADYQALAAAGQVLGLLASAIWSAYLPVRLIVLLLSACSVLAAVIAAKLISEPPFLFEGTALGRHYLSILQRFLTQPSGFLRTPQAFHVRGFFRSLRADFSGYLRILYGSILVFYLATGLTAVFVALLSVKGVSDSLIFVSSTINVAVTAPVFRYVGLRLKKKNWVRDSVIALSARAVAYGSIGVAAYFLSGMTFFIVATVLFVIGSGISSPVYYTISQAMVYDTLGVASQGSDLGIYTALTGLSGTFGALFSGYITIYAGYDTTFILSGAGMALTALIILRLRSTPLGSG